MRAPRERDQTTKAVSCTRRAPLAGGLIVRESWGGFRVVDEDKMIDRSMAPMSIRFWHRVMPAGECLIWTGRVNQDGYGSTSDKHVTVRAHRVAWELVYGPIPRGMHVLHRCDTPSCVAPLHLFLGSHADNMKDRVVKGRADSHHGEAHPSCKYPDSLIAAMRAEYARGGISQVLVSSKYGISKTYAASLLTHPNRRCVTRRCRPAALAAAGPSDAAPVGEKEVGNG